MLAPSGQRGPSTRDLVLLVSLLWLAGNGLRITILAVPPVIPLIRTELGMSETQVGILTGLPPVLFACTAVLGSLLIARFGALTTLIAGLLATAAGSALRGAAPEIWTLYAATIVTGFGVAIMHPVAAAAGARLAAAPHRLRHRGVHQRAAGRRNPSRRADHSGGAAVARQQLARELPAVGRAGRRDRARFSCCSRPRAPAPAQKAPQRWWPDWNDPLIWRLGIALGVANAMYFTANAFLPDYLHHLGRADLVSAALTALNVGQIPASLLLLAVAGKLERAIWPHIVCGAGALAAVDRHRAAARSRHRRLRGDPRLLHRRDPDPDAGDAAAARAAGRRASRLGGDVHHQLFVRRDHAGLQRAFVGYDRRCMDGVRAARRLRGRADGDRADDPASKHGD